MIGVIEESEVRAWGENRGFATHMAGPFCGRSRATDLPSRIAKLWEGWGTGLGTTPGGRDASPKPLKGAGSMGQLITGWLSRQAIKGGLMRLT